LVVGLAAGAQSIDAASSAATTGAPAVGAAPPAIAVVDLDRVAVDMGWVSPPADGPGAVSEAVARMTSARRSNSMDRRMPRPRRCRRRSFDQAAGQMYQAYQQASLKRYRDALQPVVRRIAQEKGILLVVTQTGTVVYVDPTIDITDVVVDTRKRIRRTWGGRADDAFGRRGDNAAVEVSLSQAVIGYGPCNRFCSHSRSRREAGDDAIQIGRYLSVESGSTRAGKTPWPSEASRQCRTLYESIARRYAARDRIGTYR